TLLQILSLTLFEKMPLQQAFPANEYIPPGGMPRNQMNLFEF
ncbi:MAG: IS4 family transposase, partial [Sulfuritalea sp.]|nr:IS4 family transposase [Sulfuritalea sp.]MDP2824986.1 IS4 family transposase [Sulfuritalea sp.]